MIIIQIAPSIRPGTGVGGVAHHLEQEWTALGHDVRRITHDDVGGPWADRAHRTVTWHALHAADVVWFTVAGTIAGWRAARRTPEALTVCHNDALVGDVYVNHGVLAVAMKARGNYVWRMARNPLHLFTTARDLLRFRSRIHRAVVSLTSRDQKHLVATYGRVRPLSTVIGNGVDSETFRPPSESERVSARRELGFSPEQHVTAFVGHEFERKGLLPLVESLRHLPDRHHVLVAGGDPDQVEALRAFADGHGVAGRVHTLGRVPDPLPALWAADALALPSTYEAYQLVLPEAMATGLPVIATAVGCAEDVIEEGVNGWLTDGSPTDLARLLSRASANNQEMKNSARETAAARTWKVVAQEYLDLFQRLVDGRDHR